MDPLDRLKPASGCTMDWAGMTGDEKARHCSLCSKSVHNLSAMTKSDARVLLASGGGKLCIAFSLTPDGKLLSKPEPTVISRGLAWLRGGVAFTTGLILAGCATSPSTTMHTPPAPSAACQPLNGSGAGSTTPTYIGDEGIFYTECPQVPPEKQGTKKTGH